MGCCRKSVNIISGSGSINTLYSADGSLLANRVVTTAGFDLSINGTQDLKYTDAGRLSLSLYTSGLNDSGLMTQPTNFLYTNATGLVLSANIHRAGLLPVNVEVSGNTTAELNHLIPINVASGVSTVTAPSTPAVNDIFEVCDSRANAGTYNITVNFSGISPLHGSSTETYLMNSDAAFARFRYLGGTIGWIVEK